MPWCTAFNIDIGFTTQAERKPDNEDFCAAMLVHEAWLATRMQTGRAADHLVCLHERSPGGREPEAICKLHAGTPNFISPEQWGYSATTAVGIEELPNAQSDLFALCVTLYQLLTTRLPYQSGRYYRDPVAPSRISPEVPIWLDHIVRKAVARDKRRRFETAEELLLALERGASRPLTAPQGFSLMQRDPTSVWKLALGMPLFFNFLLVCWLLFLPT